MDNAILVPIVTELRAALPGQRLADAVQIDSRRFALRFDAPPFPRLCIALHPEASSLHLVQRAPTPREPTELAVALTDELTGRELVSISKLPDERMVELAFGSDGPERRTLIVELLGKSSNLYLLDHERRILRYLRSHRGRFRRPEEGATYQPPRPRPEGSGGPMGSRLLGREAEARAGRGEDPAAAAAELARRLAEGPWEPVLYTPGPPDLMDEATDLTPSSCFVAPFPLTIGESLVATPFASASASAEALDRLLQVHLVFRDLRASLSSLASAEARRLERLLATLDSESARAAGAGLVRRQGETILASLSSARKQGDMVEVTDFFDSQAPRVRIPVDPALDLKANVEKLFRKARRMERAGKAIAARKEETERRLAGVRALVEAIGSTASTERLRETEEALAALGLARLVSAPAQRPGRRHSLVKVKEYRTSDGHVVLVGRGASDNDTLTFKVAAPHDFWLHAAGRSGAHVIVRNPSRLRELPPVALEEAAAMAAWFSKGDRGGDVDVHVTRRKEVRRAKGMPPGTVTLRACRTVRVRPAPPKGAAGGAEEPPEE